MAELQGDIEKRNIIAVIDQLHSIGTTINYKKLDLLVAKLDEANADFDQIRASLIQEVEKAERALYKIKHSI